jgi:hypothetical protein
VPHVGRGLVRRAKRAEGILRKSLDFPCTARNYLPCSLVVDYVMDFEGVADPTQLLTDAGITIAWAADMDWVGIWLPQQRVLVLNSTETRERLTGEVVRTLRRDPRARQSRSDQSEKSHENEG